MNASRLARRIGTRARWALLGFGAAVALAATVGVFGVRGTSAEYAALDRPSWAPPGWLFGPVWTLLYVLIALAGWLAWGRVGFGAAFWAWAVQLVLNAAWTPLFFAARRYGSAFAEIVVMWLAIALTVLLFARVSRPAALLMLPYWAWVTFAAALNFAIWQLNS
ncbi:TspO/MBR family protein [Micromonospora sp. NPDC005367]|uniref:TspO/MBR family protein n=1 Tax=Micromonospora sp. NPDC005367 TaxID=3155590 RepID=UPI0033BCE111